MTDNARIRRAWASVKARLIMRNIIVFVILYATGLAAVWGLSLIGVSTLVVFPVFVLGVLIASLETDSGVWGAALGIGYLLSYDLLFTEPVFALKVLSHTDLVALGLFLVISLIMGVITHRMSRQVQAAERTEAALSRLNQLSIGLLESATPQEACEVAQAFLARTLRRTVTISLGQPDAERSPAAGQCYEQHCPTGHGTSEAPDDPEKHLPLGMKGRILGVVSIDCADGDLDKASMPLITSVAAQTIVAIERNRQDQHLEEAP